MDTKFVHYKWNVHECTVHNNQRVVDVENLWLKNKITKVEFNIQPNAQSVRSLSVNVYLHGFFNCSIYHISD